MITQTNSRSEDYLITRQKFRGYFEGYRSCINNPNSRPTTSYFRTSEISRKDRFENFIRPLYEFREELSQHYELNSELNEWERLIKRIEQECRKDLTRRDLEKPEELVNGKI